MRMHLVQRLRSPSPLAHVYEPIACASVLPVTVRAFFLARWLSLCVCGSWKGSGNTQGPGAKDGEREESAEGGAGLFDFDLLNR
jgi:hypothetical protein